MEKILEEINLNVPIEDLTLGHFMNFDLMKYEKKINDIVSNAQGEMVLENMLKNIKNFWNE